MLFTQLPVIVNNEIVSEELFPKGFLKVLLYRCNLRGFDINLSLWDLDIKVILELTLIRNGTKVSPPLVPSPLNISQIILNIIKEYSIEEYLSEKLERPLKCDFNNNPNLLITFFSNYTYMNFTLESY